MSSKPGRILIVDDNASVREVLEAHLLPEEYELAFASNGYAALVLVEEFMPDVILLDVMMPDMNGFEVCKRVKAASSQWRHIPVIMVTALDGQADLIRGLDAGADDFLRKPVNGAELRARVRSMLRIKKQYDELEEKRTALNNALTLSQKFSAITAEHLEGLEILHEAGLQLISSMDSDTVLSLLSQTVVELMPDATGCCIHFLLEDSTEMLPVVLDGQQGQKQVYHSLGIEALVTRVLAENRMLYIPDINASGYDLQPQLSNLRTLLITTLDDGQQRLGTLSIFNPREDAFEQNHRYIMSILATQAAVTISKARFFEQRDRHKEREKYLVRRLFQSYVNPTVVDRLVTGGADLTLGGERQSISVLFADIRGFTGYSEKLPPEQLIETLNQYLALAVDAVLAQEGTLDKFMGDAVMAFFNAPLPQAAHTLRAVQAALTMQTEIARYNASAGSDTPLQFGIGIHQGPAVVGNIGTAQQMNYTAVGDTVNLAKRLQEIANGGEILLSYEAYRAVHEHVTVELLGPMMIKGRSTPESVYLLKGWQPDANDDC